ncbi:MAG: peptidase T [Succinivibrio sp.]
MQKGSVKDLEDLCGVDPLVKTFCDLISYDTKADPDSKTVPSSVGQLRFGAYLTTLLHSLGYDARQDDRGVISLKVLPSKGFEDAKGLCLLAHMDTAPDKSGADINPSLVKNYEGQGIALNDSMVLDESISPELSSHIGDDIIVTDGNTLLGADDKAGIAVILQLLHNIKVNPSIEHGPLTVIFTVDEEIGHSSEYVDVEKTECEYGVTVDGTAEGELDVATFNAYGAVIKFKGLSVHTAVAYKKLRNAVMMANDFISMLPKSELPETTRDLEGFYHVHDISGSTDECTVKMIIRDFEKDGIEKRVSNIKKIVSLLKDRYGADSIEEAYTFQYANMGEVLKQNSEIIELCKKAFEDAGVEVKEKSVRGGTDGSNLSNRGLPTPNIFTGGLNCHGPYECLVVGSFIKSYKVVEALVKRMALTKRKQEQ